MNKFHCDAIVNYIKAHANNLDVRLPDEADLYCARNGWCHLFGVLLDAYHLRGTNKSYKDIPDSEFDNCINILQIAVKYAEDSNVYDKFPKVDQKVIDVILNNDHTMNDWFIGS